MKNKNTCVCLLQPYLTPYRLGLFNELSRQLEGNLTLLYFSKEEQRRKWTFERDVRFREVYLTVKVQDTGYDSNRTRLSLYSLILELLKIRPAVVICNETKPGRTIRCLQFLFRFKILAWTEQTEIKLRGAKPKKWLMRFFDKGVSAYIIPGQLSKDYLQHIRGYAGPVYLAPNTINRSLFAVDEKTVAEKFHRSELRFLFSGNLIPLKGVDTLLNVFERLNQADLKAKYRLDIIGDGPVEKREVDNVYYHGFLSQEECAGFMHQANAFVLPSLWDSNPLVVTEAVSAGCVTALSDGVGNSPEYTDGNGFVFRRGDEQHLYETLVRILEMEWNELEKMALCSLSIAADVSHENSAKAFLDAIDMCLKR